MTDQPPCDQFGDDEFAFLRHVRFGGLPARVRPEEQVETVAAELRVAGGGEPTGSSPSHPGGVTWL